MLSDSGTSAGVDQVNTFRKMATFRRPKDRVLVLMSAGNLAITQAVTHVLQEEPEDHLERAPILAPRTCSMPHAWRMPCAKSNSVTARGCANKGTNSAAPSGGQIEGEEPRLFHIYPAGNFIESSLDTPYFQIGESKYGGPIIDRVISRSSSLAQAAMRSGVHGLDHPIESFRKAAVGSCHHPPRWIRAGGPHEHRYGRRVLQDDPYPLGRRIAENFQ